MQQPLKKDILNSLPLLASVLGNQYGVHVEVGGSDAYTDGRTIHIPGLPITFSDETLHLARGFIDHEAAHIRYTDFDLIRSASVSPLTRVFWNAIEDWRVENRLAQSFPGCRYNFHWLIRHFFGNEPSIDPNKEKVTAQTIVNYVVLRVRSWDVSEIGVHADDRRTAFDQVFPGLADQIDDVLAECQAACPDTASALEYARRITACMEAYCENKREGDGDGTTSEQSRDRDVSRREDKPGNGETQTDGNKEPSATQHNQISNQGDATSGNSRQQRNDNVETTPTQPHKQKPDYEQQSPPSNDNAQAELKALLDSDSDKHLPKDLADLAAGSLTGVKGRRSGKKIVVAKVKTNPNMKPMEQEDIDAALQSTAHLRARLRGLLQADTHSRRSMGRSGRLDPHCLHKVCVGDQRVFRRDGTHKAVDTAVHILLDTSGSMRGSSMETATNACYALAHALQGIPNVHTAITAFPGIGLDDSVQPVLAIGQRLNLKTPFKVDADGLTPLGPALLWALQEMLRLKQARKLVLVLTDGQPDSPQCAMYALGIAKRIGVEVYGIGIESGSVLSLMPGRSCVIEHSSDLAGAMFGMMQKVLRNL